MMGMQTSPFYRYSRYLKEKYGHSVYRIAVDAGFTCPHRGADGSGGCTFCDEVGSRAVYQEEVINNSRILLRRGGRVDEKRLEMVRRQIERGQEFLRRRYGARSFILYFQAFTNTFAPPGELKKLYDFSLGQGKFDELIVSTRPDCISRAHAELLAGYKREDRDVWVELGLQSAHDTTLRRVHREHSVERFDRARRLLKEAGLKVSIHLIFGLPGESRPEIMGTVDHVASLEPEAVKIHNVNVVEGTVLAEEYRAGEYVPPADTRHLEYVIEALQRLPPSTIIQRLTCDTVEERLAAPIDFMAKSRFYQLLDSEMQRRGVFQGLLFGKNEPV